MKKFFKPAVALLLCAVMVLGILPTAMAAQTDGKRSYSRLADLSQLEEQYLSDSEARSAEYPNGAMMIVEASAELDMGKTYAIDIFRQGGTKGEAKIKLSTVDLSAGYDEAYRLYLSDDLKDNSVEGEKKLYYYQTGVPYIARLGEEDTQYMTRDNVENLDEAKSDASEINDMSAESMPHSTETVLTFAEGENKKTVYVQTLKPREATDDLEFMLALSDPENCSISANTSGVYKILETRDKPQAQLSISSDGANPDDAEAYISVKRSGNLGGYDSFRVTTKSDTAKADEDYNAVALDLHFIPNQSEIKVPVTILDGAEDGESFKAELSDVSGNAVAENTVTDVVFDSKKDASGEVLGEESKNYVSDMTYKLNDMNYRKYEFVDLQKMSAYKVLGDWDEATFKKDNGYYEVGYSVCFCGKSHTSIARSDKPLDMYGVNKAEVCFDERSGSLNADTGVICFANNINFSNDDKEMSWRKNQSNCGYYDLWNVGPSHIRESFNITDHSAEQYLYLCCYRSACWGYAGLRVHNYNGDRDCSFRLEAQPYDVSIRNPENVKMYVNGKLEEVQIVKNSLFTDPGKTSAADTNNATFYRYDKTVIKTDVDSKYGSGTLKGIRFIDSNDESRVSETISLLNDKKFELTPDILRKYESYFHGNKIIIEPVVEFDPVDFSVQSYEDKSTGFKFEADNANHTGKYTLNGQDYGTVTWSSDSSRGGKYFDGDELNFTFTPSAYGVSNTVNYHYRYSDTEAGLEKADDHTVSNEAKDTLKVTLENKYFRVTPFIVKKNSQTRLVVTNPDDGDFTSKGTKYCTVDSSGKAMVNGIYINNAQTNVDVSFNDIKCGSRIDLTATPKFGYYAVWKYTSASTHQEKTFLGNTFNFVVQNPSMVNDNFITLTFEKVEENINKPLKGKILTPESTILHPASSSDNKKVAAEGALIYMDGYVGEADKNGQFILKQDPSKKEYSEIQMGGFKPNQRNYTQTNRALIIYNGNTYVCDVTINLANSTKACATTEIVISSDTTQGVKPIGVTAYNADISGEYGSTITLVNTRPVSFQVRFDANNVPLDKPVNLARWSFSNDKGVEHASDEKPVSADSCFANYETVLSEKAKQGDKMYVEFYNKTGDKMTFYGRFEVGYSFVNANIEKVVSYMPDIGYYDDPSEDKSAGNVKLPSAPGIGPVSPLFSLFGFTPIYSDKATGQKDKKSGKDLYCLEIGIQLSIAKTDKGDEQGSWDVSSVKKQYDKLAKLLDTKKTDPAQGLHTSTTISLTVTFAYQLEYYTTDAGVRHYTASVFLLGAKLGVKISIPFTIVVVPCFVYIDISVNNLGYLVHTPNKFTQGYWTSNTLDNGYYYDTHGVFKQNFVLKFGVGIGYDGVVSIGGHIDFSLDSTISGTNHGKMIFGIKGGLFAELLFFKVDYTWDIDKEVLLDTDAKLSKVAENVLAANSEDFIMDAKLSDLRIAKASDVYNTSVLKDKDSEALGAEAAAKGVKDTYEETTASQMVPVIGKISDNRYLIANSLDDGGDMRCLRCYIYDTEQQKVIEKFSPTEAFENTDSLTESEKKIFDKSEDVVANIDMVDCGDKLLLIWQSGIIDYQKIEDLPVTDLLKSFKVMGMLFDKKTGKFTDYGIIDGTNGKLADRVSGVYNPKTETVNVFYENIDINGITEDTSINQLNSRPITLGTASTSVKDGKLNFTKGMEINTNGKTISDYSVTSYNDNILLSYISTEQNNLILEKPLTETKYSNPDQYGTKNNMYLNRYSVGQNGELTEDSSLLIADESAVTANPEFVSVSYKGVDNTLLFYKYDGKYGYQNVNNLYLLNDHYGFINAEAEPHYITEDEDHTVGEDLKVYNGGEGELFALWTQSEGDQQQIWGRQFEIDEITEIEDVAVIDENKNPVTESNGQTKTEKLSKPAKILNGFWGNKVALTTGGLSVADGTGFYKGNRDAVVFDKDNILCAYEAFDYDYSGEKMERINNRFAISEFDLAPYYESGVEDDENEIEFSEYYPTPGQTVNVTVKAANEGFHNGSDVTLRLKSLVNGKTETVDTVEYPVWLGGEDKEEIFTYTVPEEVLSGTVQLYYEIVDDGEVKFTSEPYKFRHDSKLSIELAHADPENEFSDGTDAVKYHVTATVSNIGNDDYKGGDELDFIFNDLAVQADVMNPDVPDTEPFYINYGGVKIPEIPVGSNVTLNFVSDDIPEKIFDKYGTNSANLKLAITPEDGIGWKEVKGEEPYNFLDELGIGQFEKPVPSEVTEITAEDIEVPLGDTSFVIPVVAPASAAEYAEFKYSTENNDVIAVSDDGEITGLKQGSAVVTVTCGNVSTQVKVTVTPAVHNIIGDVNEDGIVDTFDAMLIQQVSIGKVPNSIFNNKLADVNNDGVINVLDASCVQRFAADYTKKTGNAGKAYIEITPASDNPKIME